MVTTEAHMIPNPILFEHLHWACEEHLTLFKATFPDGMEITEENIERAFGVGLLVEWAVQRLFPKPLWAEYKCQKALLLAEYERREAPLWAEYNRQETLLLKEDGIQRALLLKEYQRQRAALWKECERQRAALIVELATSGGA